MKKIDRVPGDHGATKNQNTDDSLHRFSALRRTPSEVPGGERAGRGFDSRPYSRRQQIVGASAGLLTRSSFCAFPAAGPVTSCRTFALLAGAGTHSNGYCRRFALRSLFIPLRLRRSGKPVRGQRYALKTKNQEPVSGFPIFRFRERSATTRQARRGYCRRRRPRP